MRDYDGKTAAERTHERRERLLEAGLDLFATEGFANTSIRAVLRRSGLQDRYFTESFSSLDSLMAGIVERIFDEELAAGAAAEPMDGTPTERWIAKTESVTRYLTDNPRKARVKLVEALGSGPLAAASRRKGLTRTAEDIAALLPTPAPERGIDTSLAAIGLVAGVYELYLQWIHGTEITRQQVIDHGLLLFTALLRDMGRPSSDFPS